MDRRQHRKIFGTNGRSYGATNGAQEKERREQNVRHAWAAEAREASWPVSFPRTIQNITVGEELGALVEVGVDRNPAGLEGLQARAAIGVRDAEYSLCGAVDVAREAGRYLKPGESDRSPQSYQRPCPSVAKRTSLSAAHHFFCGICGGCMGWEHRNIGTGGGVLISCIS